jgi:tetratricopeptide (TPR) repeat protein
MAMRYFFASVFFLLSFSGASANGGMESLDTARYFINNKQLHNAESVLKGYHYNYPNEVNGIRLYAQVAYWLNEPTVAYNLFETYLADAKNPYQPELVLDYSRMLFEQYQLPKAKELLLKYTKNDTTNVEANNMMGTILYWQGNADGAKGYFNKVLKQYPANDWAKKYSAEIDAALAPYLQFRSGYIHDTQPLSITDFGLEFCYKESLKKKEILGVDVQAFNLNGLNKNAYNLYGGYSFSFLSTKTTFDVVVGLYRNTAKDTTEITSKLAITQQLAKHLTLVLDAGVLPYTNTIAGVEAATTERKYQASVGYENSKVLSGKVGYIYDLFTDGNNVQTEYLWALSPAIKASIFSFNVGYAFNYANAAHSRYAATETLAEIIAGYGTTTTITGFYSPYFTPQHQQVHSVLANVSVAPTSKITVGVNSSFGVSATADNPYLYLSKVDTIAISTGFSKTNFTPVKINGNVNYNISKKWGLQLNYTYLKTFFYTSNAVTLSLKYSFNNGK